MKLKTFFFILIAAFVAAGAGCGDKETVGGGKADSTSWYKDADRDGYSDGTKSPSKVDDTYVKGSDLKSDQIDCDDNDKNRRPNLKEVCGDKIDQNCDGKDLSCEDALPSTSVTD